MLLQNLAAADALEHRFCNFRSEFREGSTGTMVMTGTSFELTRAFEWFGDTYRHCGEYQTLRHFVVFSYEKKPVYLSMSESPTKDITVSPLMNPAAY